MIPGADPLSGGMAPESIENQFKIEPESIAFIFKMDRDIFPAKAYFEDGNPEMYSLANRERRQQLKTNPEVRNAIDKFISEQFVKSGGKTNVCYQKEEYFKGFVKVGMVLRPGIELDDLTKIIKEDFDNDCADKNETDDKTAEGSAPK